MSRHQKTSYSLLWITDPWETLDPHQETTLRLLEESTALGIESYWSSYTDIELKDGKVTTLPHSVSSLGKKNLDRTLLSHFKQIHYRVDPPVDEHYLQPLRLMESVRQKIVNPWNILFGLSEKIEAVKMNPQEPFLISAQFESIKDFIKTQGDAVLKPLGNAQSKGIEKIMRQDLHQSETNKLILHATQGSKVPILLQRFQPKITEGETRLWFLDGRLLSFVKRFPLKNDFRVLIDQGSEITTTRLSPAQKRKAQEIGNRLKKLRIRLAAVDLIDTFVTDFNFTSPGLLVQMEKTTGENLAKKILRKLARA